MSKRKGRPLWRSVLAGAALCLLPLLLLAGIVLWSASRPSVWDISFPAGTEVLHRQDTHRGLLRQTGSALLVVQVPRAARGAFGRQLLAEGWIEFPPLDHVYAQMAGMGAPPEALDAEDPLWEYRDEAIAFWQEPFSHYFAALYDRESGICCCLEYDG